MGQLAWTTFIGPALPKFTDNKSTVSLVLKNHKIEFSATLHEELLAKIEKAFSSVSGQCK